MRSKSSGIRGSFSPWHQGHDDILIKTLDIFDRVIVAQGINPEKAKPVKLDEKTIGPMISQRIMDRITIVQFSGFLHKYIEKFNHDTGPGGQICAVIRGLRSGYDLDYEASQMYWNEDLGMKARVVCFITDRKLGHISSSAIRQLEFLRELERKNS